MEPALPPEAPLAMPTQSFRRWSRQDERALARPDLWRTPWLSRLFVFGGALLLTAYGVYEMYQVVSVSRTTSLQYLLVAFFAGNFSWIALAFTSAVLGFLVLAIRRPHTPRAEALKERTVIVMPVYNESTARTFAALAAIRESVEATGLGSHYDYFILSDTTNPTCGSRGTRLPGPARAAGAEARVYYRHRPKNHHRKAGNIADFVTRWGGRYEHMIVLDADSLMTGHCIVRLTAAMEADPEFRHHPVAAADHQPQLAVRPAPAIRGAHLRSRHRHRAGAMVGPQRQLLGPQRHHPHQGLRRPLRAAGPQGKAALRRAYLSHDFVEAALMRRAGWAVYMLPDLTGSYEESPPSLIDLAARDRRWCQGNLQHSRVMFGKGLHLATRQHFATGIMGYLASPFWLMQLVVGILLVLQVKYARPEYFTSEFQLVPPGRASTRSARWRCSG